MNAMKPKTSVLLSVDDVAVELGIDPVEAQRLIAKGRIAGTPIGGGDDPIFRVTVAALEKYISDGAKDARCPEYSPGGGQAWYGSLGSPAATFEPAMQTAMEEQVPPQAEIQARYDEGGQMYWMATIKGAVAELLQKLMPASTLPNAKPSRFTYWWQVYAVDLLRDAAAGIIRKLPGGFNDDPIVSLFDDGPEGFSQIANAAYASVAGRLIATSVINIPVNSKNGLGQGWTSIQLRLPLSLILTPGKRNSIIDLAF